jgi:hypothetical protein
LGSSHALVEIVLPDLKDCDHHDKEEEFKQVEDLENEYAVRVNGRSYFL